MIKFFASSLLLLTAISAAGGEIGNISNMGSMKSCSGARMRMPMRLRPVFNPAGWFELSDTSRESGPGAAGKNNDIRKLELKKDLRLISLDEIEGAKKWQRKKSAKIAVISNMLLPGLGEVYNGRRFKAAILAGLSTFYMSKTWIEYKRSIIRKNSRDKYEPFTRQWRFHNDWYEFHKNMAKDFLWWSGATWIIGMLDAYIDAYLFDLRAYRPESERSKGKYFTVSMSF